MSGTIYICASGKRQNLETPTSLHYQKLLSGYFKVSVDYIPPPHCPKGAQERIVTLECEQLVAHWPSPSAYGVALSEEGKLFTSHQFSQWIKTKITGQSSIVFNIGGAYGLSPEFKKKCRETISLSPMTFSHTMCMTMLMEQLYRAFTILHTHPYHK